MPRGFARGDESEADDVGPRRTLPAALVLHERSHDLALLEVAKTIRRFDVQISRLTSQRMRSGDFHQDLRRLEVALHGPHRPQDIEQGFGWEIVASGHR